MKIALISKLWEPTSVKSVGGTGFVVGSLADGLVKKGHEVTLFATGDSETKAKLVSVIDKHSPDYYPEALYYLNIAEAFYRQDEFDIIDCHVEEKGLVFTPFARVPVVTTIEFGLFLEDQLTLFKKFKDQNYISISDSVRQICPELNWVATVYNGIRVEDFQLNDGPKDYLLILGRVAKQKGIHYAIEVAKKMGMDLKIAGKVRETDPVDREYFEKQVKPHIDGKQIQYLGVVGYKEKIKLLENALALISPVDYIEAFGLTLIEAMASGTPAIAFDMGATGEIIKNGKTGFVVPHGDVEAMSEAVKKVNQIDRNDCRKYVAENFTVEGMVEGYEEVYRKIIKQKKEG